MADPNDPTQGFLDALANLSTYSGSTAANMAKGLVDQTKLNQTQDQLGLNRANTGVNVGNLGIAQKKLALDAPGMLAGQSVRGDVLANAQDATVSGLPSYIHVPTQTGGLRPSMLSASSRALGSQMSRNALADSTSGKYTDLPALPTVPNATPMPDPSALQGLLSKTGIASGLASTGGGILNALKNLLGGGGKPGASRITSGASSPGNGAESEANSPQTQEEDTRGTDMSSASGGTAYGPDGQPLPVGGDPNFDWEQWLLEQQMGAGSDGQTGFGLEPSAEWGG